MLRRLSVFLPLAILAAAVGIRLADPPAVEALRHGVFDTFQRIKPRAWQDADIRIVDIDDASLERLGQWPWPRGDLAALVRRLEHAGAAAVVFDMVFAEADRTAPANVLAAWARAGASPGITALAHDLPDPDRQFADALGDIPTVLAMALTANRLSRRPAIKWGLAVSGDDPRAFLPAFGGAVPNLLLLESAAAGQGSFNSDISDRDGVIRRIPLLLRLSGGVSAGTEVYPSLAAEAVRVVQGATTYIVKSAGGGGEWSFGTSTGISQVRIGGVTVPTDPLGRVWLYDTGPVSERIVPAWQVFSPGFDATRIEGKIVFVGTSASGLRDIRATPLNPAAAGVEVHVQVVEQIAQRVFLQRHDWMTGAEIVWLLAIGGLIAFLLPRWGAAWCAAVAGGGIALPLGASWLAFAELRWLVDPLYAAMTVLVLYITQSFFLFLRTEAERRYVRGAFARYLAPAVVERLARDPSRLRLGGEKRDMTLLFTDIRGFTSVSEALDAESLTRFLNHFLTPMTDIILRHNGTVDKYMGDAIMAFWNAPLDDPEHAGNAARAALTMTERLAMLNAEWRVEAARAGRVHREVAIGIGLNTGACCVGNVGSEQRFDYSALGDTVNLASRLEGQSKAYGVTTIASEATARHTPGLAWIELDLIRVKGKNAAVRIFALLGDERTAASAWFQAVRRAQDTLLAAYRAQNWPRAIQAVDELSHAADGRLEGLCDLYRKRTARYAAAPPPSDWDGVYTATEK